MMGSPTPLEEIYECGEELTTNMKKEWTTQVLKAALWCRPSNAAALPRSSEGAHPTIPRETRMEAQDPCRASLVLLS